MSLRPWGLCPYGEDWARKGRTVRLKPGQADGPHGRELRSPFQFRSIASRLGAVRGTFQEAAWSLRHSSATRRPNLRAFSAVFSSGAPTQATP